MSYSNADVQREYARNWVAARRREWFKEQGPCVKCGATEKLELDHIDRTTKVTHVVWSWTKKRRDEELLKCQVLCESCHQEKTTYDRRHVLEGFNWCYVHQGHLPVSEFPKDRARWNGLDNRCKSCRSIIDKKRRTKH